MNAETIASLARDLLSGKVRLEDFVRQLSPGPGATPPAAPRFPSPFTSASHTTPQSADLDEVTLDLDRANRCGYPEVIYSEGKSVEAILQTVERLRQAGQAVLCTRLDTKKAARLTAHFPEGIYHARARTFRMATPSPTPRTSGDSRPSSESATGITVPSEHRADSAHSGGAMGKVAIITAGTSDLPVAEEARETLRWMGIDPIWIQDVGVAGPHRLREHLDKFQDTAAIIVVAGMEGALPSVVGGYARCPVIAVPTSVGYGAALGGIAPLLGMLNSCAANVTVVNIDAGFKGAYVAGLFARHGVPPPATPATLDTPAPRVTQSGSGLSRPNRPADLPQLPVRAADGHKGTYGHVVIIGGSKGMSGAVGLAGMAALRSGAGLVTLAVPGPVAPAVAAQEPSYMTWPLPADADGRLNDEAYEALLPLLSRAQCVAIGPGLGRGPCSDLLVARLFETLNVPLVVDADGLNALSERPWGAAAGARILTPHPGEYRRLCPDAPRDRQELEKHAIAWGESEGVTLILKGHRSLITESGQAFWNTTGNPGMATGGTGDVLTGVVTAILGQGLAPAESARLACYVHGRAGDLAADQLGQVSLIASDLIRWLPAAWREVQGAAPAPDEPVSR